MLTIPGIVGEARRRLDRDVGYAELLELAADGDAAAEAVVVAAGTALGRMLALVANMTAVGDVVIAGDGIALYTAARDHVAEALRADRRPLAGPVRIIADAAGFDEWARGAAASAIQSLVLDG
jgi:predicted NBD/HSP70 family sugar kinase